MQWSTARPCGIFIIKSKNVVLYTMYQRACGVLAFGLARILPTVGSVMTVLVQSSRHGFPQCRCASAQWRVPASSAGVSARFFVKGSQSHDLAKLGGAFGLQVWWPLSVGVPPTEVPGHQSLEVRRAQSAPVQ